MSLSNNFPKWNSTCGWCCLGHWYLHRKLVWWNHVQDVGWVCSEASVYICWHVYLSVCMCMYNRKVFINKIVYICLGGYAHLLYMTMLSVWHYIPALLAYFLSNLLMLPSKGLWNSGVLVSWNDHTEQIFPHCNPSPVALWRPLFLPLHSSQIWKARLQDLASRSLRETECIIFVAWPLLTPIYSLLAALLPRPTVWLPQGFHACFPDSWYEYDPIQGSAWDLHIFCGNLRFSGTLKTATHPTGSWPHNATRLTI